MRTRPIDIKDSREKDSREFVEELDELENDIGEEYESGELDPDDPDAERLEELRALNEEGKAIFGGEWIHGVTLVNDADFEEYARELAEDIGAVDGAHDWPLYCIDWQSAAADLRMDYYAIEIGSEVYWGRM